MKRIYALTACFGLLTSCAPIKRQRIYNIGETQYFSDQESYVTLVSGRVERIPDSKNVYVVLDYEFDTSKVHPEIQPEEVSLGTWSGNLTPSLAEKCVSLNGYNLFETEITEPTAYSFVFELSGDSPVFDYVFSTESKSGGNLINRFINFSFYPTTDKMSLVESEW